MTAILSNSNPAEVAIPTNCVFAAGQSVAEFTLQALTDGVVDGQKVVDLAVLANGFSDGTLSIVVQDADTPQLSLSFASSSVVEGGSLRGTVSRPFASAD